MRNFIVVCLLAVACADKLGYNYHPVPHSEQGLSFTPGAKSTDLSIPSTTAAAQPISASANTEYRKQFYSYSAPEEAIAGHQQVASALKKSLRVVFIKAPHNAAVENAALSLAKQAADEKTAIYVLTKQADIGSLTQQLQNAQPKNVPQVHFVKYRTPQDAINAQLAIQHQYNGLPGSTRNSNEGIAPVLNFASRVPVAAASVPPGPAFQYLPANPLPQEYLPPSLRRFRQ
ncbi:uncharacterized protein LOC128858269 [Anastrepha ludens]|uniref:uncharacterized protein LOC128858269 n=1 Tax=Anastrepha ludens TaxID=28586 RepID=UPI0023B1EF23|nr:uncharacterized protein LOC128858269 [Anastrepha ludens]